MLLPLSASTLQEICTKAPVCNHFEKTQDLRKVMVYSMKRLSTLSALKKSGFGQPSPRHGLRLIWWFVHECVHLENNGQISARCAPANGDFGFHRFHNYPPLLPRLHVPYYEVGNLKPIETLKKLPDYVRESYKGYESNCDRIIVSCDSWKMVDVVYVTKHSDHTNFDPNQTYEITTELLREIKRINLHTFLSSMRNDLTVYNFVPQNALTTVRFQCEQIPQFQPPQYHQSSCDDLSCCALAFIFLMAILFVGSILTTGDSLTQDLRKVMVYSMKRLSTLSALKKSGFGQPSPRHGLRLIWWFVHECVHLENNGQISARCAPANGDFGFHRFHNYPPLLPRLHVPYYEVGNLKPIETLKKLPDYVRESYKGYESNCDRIIVSCDSWKMVDVVYVTKHSDHTNFDPNQTYEITTELLREIKRINLHTFLSSMRNDLTVYNFVPQNALTTVRFQCEQIPQFQPPQYHQSSCDDLSCCALAFIFLMAILFVGFVFSK
ncbi:hypothetical protein DNTS_003128 [Danionella cerebrum]|uniref:Uncharacterized protein n=1 Tax=Danionella cerebrum TaxID=2873325 RepID=A0A553N0H4_9TELE|nr:hypothetical protein DNTS_003128 [Danionella translucida]